MSIIVALLLSLAYSSPAFTFTSTDNQKLNNIFDIYKTSEQSWLGADVGTSVNLGDNKFLWIFGDTLLGSIANETRKIEHFIHNTVGILYMNPKTHLPIGSMQFYYQGMNSPTPKALFHGNSTDEWYYWPVSATTAYTAPEFPPKSPTDKLFIFAAAIQNQGNSFIEHGTVIFTVDNPQDTPSSWIIEKSQILPFSDSETNCASGVTVYQGFVYILCFSTPPGESSYQSLFRIDSENFILQNWTSISVWGYSTESINKISKAQWIPFAASVTKQAIFSPGTSETTIQYNQDLGGWFVLPIEFGSPNPQIRTSTSLTGPWTDTIDLFDIPDPLGNMSINFCYACKSHPEFSTGTEITFSYNCNSRSPSELVDDLLIYLPKFVTTVLGTPDVEKTQPQQNLSWEYVLIATGSSLLVIGFVVVFLYYTRKKQYQGYDPVGNDSQHITTYLVDPLSPPPPQNPHVHHPHYGFPSPDNFRNPSL